MFQKARELFAEIAPAVDFFSLRLVRESNEILSVRRGVLDPVFEGEDVGAMLTVLHEGGLGYAATCDLTPAALEKAAARACEWASHSAGRMVFDQPELRLHTLRALFPHLSVDVCRSENDLARAVARRRPRATRQRE